MLKTADKHQRFVLLFLYPTTNQIAEATKKPIAGMYCLVRRSKLEVHKEQTLARNATLDLSLDLFKVDSSISAIVKLLAMSAFGR
ncbi:hypothetical protein [Massilia sp. BHUDP2]|uniref:hypothetical protein n=1 Tax=Massilia sp. BHUDP2 TaxID=3034505 RepID=UPI0039066AD1